MVEKYTYDEWVKKVGTLEKNSEKLKRAEAAIQKNHHENKERLKTCEETSRAWLEHSPVCTKIVDLDFNLQFMSSSGVRDLKVDDITDYYGRPYPFSFYPDSFKVTMASNLIKVKETGEIVKQEAFVNDTKGSKLWYHSTLVPVKNEKDQINYIMIVSVNITEQKQAEDALMLAFDNMKVQTKKRTTELNISEDRFALAMRGANDGLWDWNLETDEVYYSPRWKSMLGYEENELDSKIDTWLALVHPDDKDWVLKKAQDYIAGLTDSFEVEKRMYHKDGHEVVVLSRAFLVLHDSNDKPVRLVGTHVDMTERKKSEQFILKTSSILKMIATREPASEIYDAIALLYESRHPGLRCSMLILVGTKLMHGGAPSLPKEYCDAVNGLENGPNVGSCGTATYYGKRVLVENIETDPKWEKIKHVALPHGMRCCWSEPIKNSSGKVLGAFGMYYNYPALPSEEESRDLESAARLAGIIMEREKSEKELIGKQAQLAHAGRLTSLGEMATGIAHEINQPLTIISLATQVLRINLSKDDSTNIEIETISSIEKQVSRASNIINNMRRFARLNADSTSLVDISEPLPIALSFFQEQFRLNEIKLTTSISESLPKIRINSQKFEQIVINFLSNARYAVEKKAKYENENYTKTIHIHLSASPGGNEVVFEIRDNGIGMTAEEQEHCLEPFFTSKEVGQGTGLGLSITHNIVTEFQGSIEVNSTEGEGTLIKVVFPAGDEG